MRSRELLILTAMLAVLACPTASQALTVSGHATADCIGPVEGMQVSLYSYDPINKYNGVAVTDAQGYYAFTEVPVSTRGGRLSITKPYGTTLVSPPSTSVTLTLTVDETVDVVLQCIVGRVYGYVQSDCDGRMADIPVHLDLGDGSPPLHATTDASGNYEFLSISSLHEMRIWIDAPERYEGPKEYKFFMWGTNVGRSFNIKCPPTVIYFQNFETDDHGWTPYSKTGISYGEHWQQIAYDHGDGQGTRGVLWCGAAGPDPCFATLPGYGESWVERLVKTVTLPAGSQMTLVHQYDTEQDFDFCRVEISTDGGVSFAEVGSFDGFSGGDWDGPSQFTQDTIDLSAYTGTVDLRLQFQSDGGTSDQDGHQDTNGAWRLDWIEIPGVLRDDFVTGLDGWTVPPRVGDELAQFRLQSNPICEPSGLGTCLSGMGRSWVAYDPSTGEVPTNPQWLLDRSQLIEIGIESDEIQRPADAGEIILAYCPYVGNQGHSQGRWTHVEIVSRNQAGCEITRSLSPWYYYGTDDAGWIANGTRRDNIQYYIQPGATTFRVRLFFWDLTGGPNLFGLPQGNPDPPGYPSEAPYFDNVLIAARGTSHPGVEVPYSVECPPGWATSTGPITITVSGNVTSGECQGPLAGVPVDLLAGEDLYLTTVTNNQGNYSFEGIPTSSDPGEVSIQIPLGYLAVTPEDGHTAVDLTEDRTVDFTLACGEPAGPARTIGYWKHQANVYLDERGHAQETLEDMTENFPLALFSHFHENDLNAIAVEGVTYRDNNGVAEPITLEIIRNTLTVNRGGTMCDRAKQQYLALLLNVASGKLQTFSIICEDGRTTVSQALQEAADLIMDGDSSNDEQAKDIGDILNNGGLVPEGMVRESWVTIPYPEDDPTIVQIRTYEYDLDAPRPNPFTPSTGIRFEMARPGLATARIFDSAGRLVRTLLDERREAGEHLLTWDGMDDGGSRAPSGVYFLRFQADGRQATRQMILTK